MQVILFEKMVEKFPVYDPNWTDEVQAKWMELYVELFRWGCRLIVEEATAQI